jgi:hypothetical protein
MFSGEGLFAIKVMAAAVPIAGFAAVAHVRARRRSKYAHEAAAATSAPRSIIIEVPRSELGARGSVRFELTPHLMRCLAAANSGSLRGLDSPDAVMMALEVDAIWKGQGKLDVDEEQPHQSRLIATRELIAMRSSSVRGCESVKVPLKTLLEAHRRTPEGEPLFCSAEGEIRAAPTRRLHVGEVRVPKQFYWARAGAAAAAAAAAVETQRTPN